MRSIPIGGNNFTETLVKAFKLPFAKAEDLKRNAATSKYARQIFQAMRPVFADLVAEIQRSVGFMRRSTAIRASRRSSRWAAPSGCLGCRNIYSRTSRSMSSGWTISPPAHRLIQNWPRRSMKIFSQL